MSAPAEPHPVDPSGFWPGRMQVEFRPAAAAPGPFVRMLRHVPTIRTRAEALAFCGSRAQPLIDAWAEAFAATIGDPEAIADTIAPAKAPGTDGSGMAIQDLALLDAATAAAVRAATERASLQKEVRAPALHVLEDAAHFLEFTRRGVDFALVGNPYSLSPVVIAGRAGQPPRLLDPSGEETEQVRHAAAVRAMRAIMEKPFRYWESPAFRRLSGRGFALASGQTHLGAILADMARAGHSRAFLKHAMSKRGTWVVDLPPEAGIGGMSLSAHAAMGAAYGDLHVGALDAMRQVLVQEFLPFTHEHRFLVADHRIVASTASDRAIGVLDARPGRRLHPGVAALLHPASDPGSYDRGDARLVCDRGLVARMARVARKAVAAFRMEGMLPPHYCLDVGLTERGVLPIEVNTLHHCGIYAADWSRVASALARLGEGPAFQASEQGGRARADAVADAIDFLLDVLWDGPPVELVAVARRISDFAAERDPTLARARGILARDRVRHETEDTPLDPGLVALAKARVAESDVRAVAPCSPRGES